jgi:hypothetical protein
MAEKYQDMWGDLKHALIEKDLLDKAYWDEIEFQEKFYNVKEYQSNLTEHLKEQAAWKRKVGLL